MIFYNAENLFIGKKIKTRQNITEKLTAVVSSAKIKKLTEQEVAYWEGGVFFNRLT